MEQESKVSPFFIIFEHEKWWPYVKPLVVDNQGGRPFDYPRQHVVPHLRARGFVSPQVMRTEGLLIY